MTPRGRQDHALTGPTSRPRITIAAHPITSAVIAILVAADVIMLPQKRLDRPGDAEEQPGS
jgi:hypothetical protein